MVHCLLVFCLHNVGIYVGLPSESRRCIDELGPSHGCHAVEFESLFFLVFFAGESLEPRVGG